MLIGKRREWRYVGYSNGVEEVVVMDRRRLL
jgi:hypothetical protein